MGRAVCGLAQAKEVWAFRVGLSHPVSARLEWTLHEAARGWDLSDCDSSIAVCPWR